MFNDLYFPYEGNWERFVEILIRKMDIKRDFMLIKWAHLSDIHFMYKSYETKVMRDKLIEYLGSLKNDVDYLFITGDIADKGCDYDNEVFSFLDSVLQALEIKKDGLFMVPGNHDIRRNKMAERLIKGIISDENAMKEINELDEETFHTILSLQQPFFDFYRKYLGEEYPKDELHFVKSRRGLNIIHINTCLVAGISDAEGKILVGLNKLYDALKRIPNDTSINIAIGHHSFECIHPSEKEGLLNRFSDSNVDIYLNGHVHKASYHHEVDNYNEIHVFTAGSIKVDNYADPLFITGIVDTGNGSGEIVYHRWNSKGEFWHIDNTVGRKTKDGVYNFEIIRLKGHVAIEDDQFEVDVNEDEFRDFLVDFHNAINSSRNIDESLISKDITDKFINMLCTTTFRKQFDKFSRYFPIINRILSTTSFFGIDKRLIIPNIIITEYQEVYQDYDTGDLILVQMVNNLYNKYGNKVRYSEQKLKVYLKILIFWSINECDIFNEDKRQKV